MLLDIYKVGIEMWKYLPNYDLQLTSSLYVFIVFFPLFHNKKNVIEGNKVYVKCHVATLIPIYINSIGLHIGIIADKYTNLVKCLKNMNE